jgi:epoxyqueuosine reductase
MKRELAALAKHLGFDACRVAQCVIPPGATAFAEWLDQGRHGEMAWMERTREQRMNPRLSLPGARSVIVLALNYFQGNGDEKKTGGEFGGIPPSLPRIARYAWGDDYHELIGKKLAVLDIFLRGHGGTQKCHVDTGPVLERDFAALAGVGWQGKSTMLISRQLGTWFFLAVILTTLEIAPDTPHRDHCGQCTRCIGACPTGAITGPRQLDARRCIAYLTIELKGSIPPAWRPFLGDRVFGCDECLAACPWNRFARVSQENAFAARRDAAGMPLAGYLGLTDGQFRELFHQSPIKRIKRRGFLRNVCVALGNVGGETDIPALERAASDPEPLIAEHARWALEQVRARAAIKRCN